MRRRLKLRARRARMAVLGVLTVTMPAAPLVAAAAHATAAPDIRVVDSSLRYGQEALVRGTAGTENARRQVALEYSAQPGQWRVIATTTADGTGRYALRARLARSGALRVAVGDGTAIRAATDAEPAAAVRSAERPVAVAARIVAPVRRLDVRPGGTAMVAGRLSPGVGGRLVRLERRDGARWHAVAADRTDAAGRFRVGYRVRGVGSHYVRLTFAGDAANAPSVRRIGTVSGYRATLASRYDLYGGALACGGSLGADSMVVAHRSLPCGTKVRIRYRGHAVTATVRDRGPYVGGREFDLAGAVARRLGFDGVGTIWVAVA
jgi:rare lipoprotein A